MSTKLKTNLNIIPHLVALGDELRTEAEVARQHAVFLPFGQEQAHWWKINAERLMSLEAVKKTIATIQERAES